MAPSSLLLQRHTLLQTAFPQSDTNLKRFAPCTSAQTHLQAWSRVSRCPAYQSGGAHRGPVSVPKALEKDDEIDFREDAPPSSSSTKKGNCYGCGIALQTEDVHSPGFVDPEKYELKKHHRQLDQLVCLRCQSLSNGAMVPGVEDMWVPPDGSPPRRLLSPAQLRRQLADIKGQRALVVLLIDLTDASGSFLGRVRDLVGQNPIILVGTKVDLLPKGTEDDAVVRWLQATANHKRLNVAGVSLCSSRSKAGVPETVAAIRKERKGRNVYIIGAANVGKSAFTRALVREMSQMGSMQYDAAAAGAKRRLPVESAMPGTTLHMIPLKAFESGGTLYDTPGLHLHHRIQHMLAPQEVRALQPRARLKPYVAPRSPSQPPTSPEEAEGVSYLLGGLARIDILSASPSAHLTFFMPPALRVETLPLLGDDATPPKQNPRESPGSPSPSRESPGLRSVSRESPSGVGQATSIQGGMTGGDASPQGISSSWEEAAGQGIGEGLEAATGQGTRGSSEEPAGQGTRGSLEEAAGQGTGGSLMAATGQGTRGSLEEAAGQGVAERRGEAVPHGTGSWEEGGVAEGSGDDPEEMPETGEGGEERFGERSVAARGGLQMVREVWLKAVGAPEVSDIAISGLPGWISLVVPSGKGSVWLRVWAPVGVEVFVRPSMPVGPGGNGGSYPAPAGNWGSYPAPAGKGGRDPAPAGIGGRSPAPGGTRGSCPAPAGNEGRYPAPAGKRGRFPAPATESRDMGAPGFKRKVEDPTDWWDS